MAAEDLLESVREAAQAVKSADGGPFAAVMRAGRDVAARFGVLDTHLSDGGDLPGSWGRAGAARAGARQAGTGGGGDDHRPARHRCGGNSRRPGPADLTADSMRVLFDQVLAAVPAIQRGQAEDWLTDLLDLATGNLSADAWAEVVLQALAEKGRDAERAYEVSLGTRIVTATSPREAAALARKEWREEAGDPHHEPDPNEVYGVRPAHSRGRWQRICPDKPV